MMNKKIIFVLLYAVTGFLSSCSKMNDNFTPYMENGEIIYIGKTDSVKTFAGNERFLINFIIKDPRADQLFIYWSQRQDSMVIPITEHNPMDIFSIYIGKNEKTLTQGNHTLELVTKSQNKYKSIKVFATVNVYGSRFAQTLLPKIVKLVKKDTNENVTITWGGAVSEKELGVKLTYQNKSNQSVTTFLTTAILKKPTVLSDIQLADPLNYETLYIPEKTAIDTFRTEPRQILIP